MEILDSYKTHPHSQLQIEVFKMPIAGKMFKNQRQVVQEILNG